MDLAFALRALVRTIDRGSMSAAARGLVRDGVVAPVAVKPVLTTNVVEDLSAGRLVRVMPQDAIVPTELVLIDPSARLLRPALRAFIDAAVPALQAIPGIARDEAVCA